MAAKLSSIVTPGKPMVAAAATPGTPLVRAVNDPRSAPATSPALSAFYGSSPAAPAPNPGAQPATIEPNHAYDQSFQNALASSRAGIAAQVRNALAETQREQAAGNQELGTMMPTVNGITSAGRAGLAHMAAGADSMQRDAGFRSYTPASADVAPSDAAMSQLAQFQQGAVPLIKSGIADRAAQRQAAVQQYQAEMNAQLQAQEAQYAMQRQLAQMQIDAQTKAQSSDLMLRHQLSVEDAQRQHGWDVAGAQTDFNNKKSLYSLYEGPGSSINPSTGISYNQQQQVEKSPEYQRYAQALTAGTIPAEQVFRYLTSKNPSLLATLADSGSFPALTQLFAGAAAPQK